MTTYLPRNREARFATWMLGVGALLAPFVIQGQSVQVQSGDSVDSATLQGSVRDWQGRPVAAASVYLRVEGGTQPLTAHTDSSGAFRFSELGEGVYTLRAELAGYGEATFGPCALGGKETKEVDLTLGSQKGPRSGKQSASFDTPQFFDEPEFTVAGVTEAMNPGGHGSDTILQSSEALERDTVSLKDSPRSSRLAASVGPTEESLRKAVEHEPGNFDANRRLGKLLADEGNLQGALPYLERASQLNPGDYENDHELALAYAETGQYERARTKVRALLSAQDKAGVNKAGRDLTSQNEARQHQAELHELLGDVEDKLGDALEAVRNYQRAADLNPSEPNLFDWGADLLLHRAFEPAIEVFVKGHRLFPQSVRMLVGLGVAWYARGSYEQAAQSLCEASDLDPDDPKPYLFIGKMQSVDTDSGCAAERLRRFAGLQPESALANYYYALSLWKRRKGPNDAETLGKIESLLEKAVHVDPKLGAGYLQLGILYSDRGDSPKAIAAYENAVAANPKLEEAHYRLAQAYKRAGETQKAQQQLQLYAQISKEAAQQAERERREIHQFVYTLRGPSSVQPQH
jgi:tetratricopeptide (TPR) repeat protein